MLGRESEGQEHWQGFAIDRGYLQAAVAKDRSRTWENLSSDRPPAVCFWYRVGGDQIALPALLGNPLPARVFPLQQGMVTVRLDGRGSLLEYSVSTDQNDSVRGNVSSAGMGGAVSTGRLVDVSSSKPIRPVRAPPMYADSLLAWEGAYPENPTMPIRVEGASLGNRVVFFKVTPRWDQDWTDAEQGPSRVPRRMSIVKSTLYLLAIIAGGFLAWHNIRLGRGDQPGACKLLVFVMFLGLLDWLLGERHVAVFAEEIALFYLWLARATLTAAIAWVSYFAVEPYVRRRWPQMMITWSRLLRGKIRDPLVGRDILLGGMCGILLVLVTQLEEPAAWLARFAVALANPAESDPGTGCRARAAVQARHLDHFAYEQHHFGAGSAAVNARATGGPTPAMARINRLLAAAYVASGYNEWL